MVLETSLYQSKEKKRQSLLMLTCSCPSFQEEQQANNADAMMDREPQKRCGVRCRCVDRQSERISGLARAVMVIDDHKPTVNGWCS
jgi:hypothetical protein